MSHILTRHLDCGMTLVMEPIPSVKSLALNWVLPAGSATDPAAKDGLAALLSEMLLRGTSNLTSREHSDELDRLGVQRSVDVQTFHMRIDAVLVGEQLRSTLPLIVDMIRKPALPAEALDPVRSLCLQALDSLDDEPQHLAMLKLREQHVPIPLNRHGYGRREVLQHATIDDVRSAWHQRFRPGRSILAVAGAFDPAVLTQQLNTLLSGWAGTGPEPADTKPAARGYLHINQPTAQVHIGLAFDAPREADEHSILERIAVNVLSGSSSGRLFTEVRQKRSLCYSVGASYRSGRDAGNVMLYAGTTPERAQDTLDVCCQEIERIKSGVTQAEFHRAVTGLKAHQIMRGESTPARAAALIYDQFRIGRARTLVEMAAQLDAVTIEQVNEYIAQRDFGEFTVVSIGPAALAVPNPQAA